jgi:hypothetical protein
MLSMDLSYDRWYYDVDSGNSYRTEVSFNGGVDWTLLEELLYSAGGWETETFDLFVLQPPTDDMRLRFVVDDNGADDPVEGAIDEVVVTGTWIECQDYTPLTALPPNPVADTLQVGKDAAGHAVLTWEAPPTDGSHDAATLYRIERATSPAGPFEEAGSATVTRWVDVDALNSADSYYYRARAENSGGSE